MLVSLATTDTRSRLSAPSSFDYDGCIVLSYNILRLYCTQIVRANKLNNWTSIWNYDKKYNIDPWFTVTASNLISYQTIDAKAWTGESTYWFSFMTSVMIHKVGGENKFDELYADMVNWRKKILYPLITSIRIIALTYNSPNSSTLTALSWLHYFITFSITHRLLLEELAAMLSTINFLWSQERAKINTIVCAYRR